MDLDACHKQPEILARKLRPILQSLAKHAEMNRPQTTDLDGSMIALQDRICSIVSRVRL